MPIYMQETLKVPKIFLRKLTYDSQNNLIYI